MPQDTIEDLRAILDLLGMQKLKIINLGLVRFAETISAQGGEVVHVAWEPPSEDRRHISALLGTMSDPHDGGTTSGTEI